MYVTSNRGPTYVYTANLNMEDETPAKWILSGTCLLMSDDWFMSVKFNRLIKPILLLTKILLKLQL